jgi:hypothetical protein
MTNQNILCTGTLITESLILTSAHCFLDTNITMYQIIIKNHEYWPNTIYYPIWWVDFISWAMINRQEIFPQFHDIAVLKVNLFRS